jgi:hypothetical protein
LPENNMINSYNYWWDDDEYKYNRMYSHTKEEVELILSNTKFIK